MKSLSHPPAMSGSRETVISHATMVKIGRSSRTKYPASLPCAFMSIRIISYGRGDYRDTMFITAPTGRITAVLPWCRRMLKRLPGTAGEGCGSAPGRGYRCSMEPGGRTIKALPLPNLSINAICPDSSGSVYIATVNGTVKYYDGTWENYSFSRYNISYDQIHDAVVDKYGKLWVASGLNYGQETGFHIYPDSLQYFELEKMHNVNLDHWYWWIGDIFTDRSNNKWITTSYGLDKVTDEGVELFNTSNSDIPDNYTFAAAQDAAGNIWIGTIYGGLAKYDGTNWTVYDTTNSGLPSNAVTQIIIDKNQNIWAATENGLAEFTGSSWNVINKDNSDIRENVIFHFALDNNGGIWLGNQYGLHHFDGFRWENFNEDNSPMATNFIDDIKVDKDNNVWVAVYRGGLLKKNADGWTVYNEDNSPLLNNDINSLYIDQNNNKIIGTNTGLNLFNEDGINIFYEPDPEKLSDYFTITQNYPNPFNISTRMMYGVAVESWVRIKVYNILGKEVRTLVNERKVPGYYSVDFNGEGLASGVYIYRMQVGRFVQSRKAILIK